MTNLVTFTEQQINVYDEFAGNDLVIASKIQQRRLQILIHSCLYYDLNTNMVSDLKWDTWAKELVQLQKDYPAISEKVMWYDAFKDWDGTTGAFLPIHDGWVMQKALILSGQVKKEHKEIKKRGKLF